MKTKALDPQVLDSIRDLQSEDEPDFFRAYFVEFLTAVPDRLNGLEKAIGDLNAHDLDHEAHSLRSSCANSGANEMALLCGELESLGKASRFDGAIEFFEKLKAEFERVRREVHEFPEFKNGT